MLFPLSAILTFVDAQNMVNLVLSEFPLDRRLSSICDTLSVDSIHLFQL